jgi:hypothetical protein
MIRGLSEKRELNRVGKVKIGKKVNDRPTGTDYFVFVPSEGNIENIESLAENQNKLIIRFPYSTWYENVPQFRKMYSKAGLVCKGDGEKATWRNGEKVSNIDCIGDDCSYSSDRIDELGKKIKRKCFHVLSMHFYIPAFTNETGIAGTWQFDTSSEISIIALNSSLESYFEYFTANGGDVLKTDFEFSVYFKKRSGGGKRFPVVALRPIVGAVKESGFASSEELTVLWEKAVKLTATLRPEKPNSELTGDLLEAFNEFGLKIDSLRQLSKVDVVYVTKFIEPILRYKFANKVN